MKFAQRRNRLTTDFSERNPIVNRHMTVHTLSDINGKIQNARALSKYQCIELALYLVPFAFDKLYTSLSIYNPWWWLRTADKTCGVVVYSWTLQCVGDEPTYIYKLHERYIIQWRTLIIIADNVMNRLLLSKSVVQKHSI